MAGHCLPVERDSPMFLAIFFFFPPVLLGVFPGEEESSFLGPGVSSGRSRRLYFGFLVIDESMEGSPQGEPALGSCTCALFLGSPLGVDKKVCPPRILLGWSKKVFLRSFP